MTDKEAAKAALDALTNCTSEHGHRCNRCDSEIDEGGRVAEALRAALAAAQPAPEQNERAEFEAALFDLFEFAPDRPSFECYPDGDYVSGRTHKFWRVWQARAALAAPVAAAPAPQPQPLTPLTDEQIVAAANEAFDTTIDLDDNTLVNKYGHGIYISRYLDFARAIESAHGIKGAA